MQCIGRPVAVIFERVNAGTSTPLDLFDNGRHVYAASGDVVPLVARTFELDDVPAAQRFLIEERPFGKVVLRVGASDTTI